MRDPQLPKRLRFLLGRFHGAFDGSAASYPETKRALEDWNEEAGF